VELAAWRGITIEIEIEIGIAIGIEIICSIAIDPMLLTNLGASAAEDGCAGS